MTTPTTYPRLPDPPACGPEEPIAHYGARLFTWLLASDVTATCSDVDLERALTASTAAIAQPDLSPIALARIVDMRRRLTSALAHRRGAAAGPPASVAPPQRELPGGRPAALVRPLASQPPGGALAELEF
jgi:hypothetical protein